MRASTIFMTLVVCLLITLHVAMAADPGKLLRTKIELSKTISDRHLDDRQSFWGLNSGIAASHIRTEISRLVTRAVITVEYGLDKKSMFVTLYLSPREASMATTIIDFFKEERSTFADYLNDNLSDEARKVATFKSVGLLTVAGDIPDECIDGFNVNIEKCYEMPETCGFNSECPNFSLCVNGGCSERSSQNIDNNDPYDSDSSAIGASASYALALTSIAAAVVVLGAIAA